MSLISELIEGIVRGPMSPEERHRHSVMRVVRLSYDDEHPVWAALIAAKPDELAWFFRQTEPGVDPDIRSVAGRVRMLVKQWEDKKRAMENSGTTERDSGGQP